MGRIHPSLLLGWDGTLLRLITFVAMERVVKPHLYYCLHNPQDINYYQLMQI